MSEPFSTSAPPPLASGQLFALPPSATIRDIKNLHAALLAALAGDHLAAIDCGAVEDADVSLLQLLLAVRRRAAGRTPVAVMVPPGSVVAALLDRSGLAAEFN